MRAQPTPIVDLRLGFFDFFGFLEALLHEPAGPYPIVAGSLGFFSFFGFSRRFAPCTWVRESAPRRRRVCQQAQTSHGAKHEENRKNKKRQISVQPWGGSSRLMDPIVARRFVFFRFFGFFTALLHELSGPPKKALEWVPGWGQQ